MSFTELDFPAVDKNGEEYTHKCNSCGKPRAYEYFGVWIDREGENAGEFGDDRWVIECFACGQTEEA